MHDIAIKLRAVWTGSGSPSCSLVFFSSMLVYLSPPWPDAVDPMGKHFPLSREGKAAIAIFLWAGTWWVFEVVPIGVTSLLIGALQVLFLVRPAKVAFKDFMDSVRALHFRIHCDRHGFHKDRPHPAPGLQDAEGGGDRTSMILLGCYVVTAALTHIMAHTAVAATIYPLLVSIYALYGENDRPTKFGKALFMGMAYVAGAGSIVTLLGAARGAVALASTTRSPGKRELLRTHLLHVPRGLDHDLPALGFS